MKIDTRETRNRYRSLLLDGFVPFWFRHGIDWDRGGVFSCMNEEGGIQSGDKYIWSQARSAWTFSALYNRLEKRREYLKAAENSVRFLMAHGRDADGRWVYRTDREGAVIEGPISIYSDCFAVYGLNEYFRASGDRTALEIARETFRGILERVQAADFSATAPYPQPPGRKPHGVPMILTEVANELFVTTGENWLEDAVSRSVGEIMNRFLRPDRRLLLEFLGEGYTELPPPEGTAVMPGHAIESMWFVLHVARRRGDAELIGRAAEAIRWHLEAGWDSEYGGIFLGIDAEGGQPFIRHARHKLWWPHTEALYALLLAWKLTGEDWCLEWYWRVYDWSFAHFPMNQGEWRQRLTREGEPTTEVIGLPVKDPFHLPRAAILILGLLEYPE